MGEQGTNLYFCGGFWFWFGRFFFLLALDPTEKKFDWRRACKKKNFAEQFWRLKPKCAPFHCLTCMSRD